MTEKTDYETLSAEDVQKIYETYALWNESGFRDFASKSVSPSYFYPSAFSPQLINERMKSITLIGGGTVTVDEVNRALLNPKGSEEILLQISETFEYSIAAYKRILAYLSNLPAWDWTYHCKTPKVDYKSKKYKAALDIVKDFTERFNIKSEMPIVMRQLLRQETFFSVLRDEGSRYVLQELPANYCLITGRFDYGLLFSFNYMFFQQQGIDIDMYPPVFKETYSRLVHPSKNGAYNPSLSIDGRGKSGWVLWGDCSPNDNFWMWKFSPELVARIPYFASLFPDFAYLATVRDLQQKEYLSAAAKILFTELPFLKDQKATVKDSLAMTPAILGEFMAYVKANIDNVAIKFIEAPAQNAQAIAFDHDNDMLANYSRTMISQSGVSSNLISNFDQKMNALETQLSAEVDEQLVKTVYPACNAFMEYHINKRIKDAGLDFEFGFNFEGCNFHTDQQRRMDIQSALMDRGIVLPQKIAASVGLSPFVMESMMKEASDNEFIDKLTPIVMASQMSGSTSQGRPRKSDASLGEEGMNTRDAASNVSKGGKI